MGLTQPSFSIVIPTYARPERLANCLRAISTQAYSSDKYEVIVVDDGSPIPPRDLIDRLPQGIKIRLLIQTHAGPAQARNLGAREASGDFIAFTDDDCMPAQDWLQELAICFAASPASAIGGHTVNGLTRNSFSTASQLLIDYLYAYHNTVPCRAAFFATNNLAVPARLFNEVGGFDTGFPLAGGEDREFCDRWRYRGYRMEFAPKAVVCHMHRMTLRTFWRQHFNYGRGANLFHDARAKQRQEKIRIEPMSFYINLLLWPFSQIPNAKAFWLTGLMLVSQVANAAGFFWDRARGQRYCGNAIPRQTGSLPGAAVEAKKSDARAAMR
jgi:GT2 family glycosyltransferase